LRSLLIVAAFGAAIGAPERGLAAALSVGDLLGAFNAISRSGHTQTGTETEGRVVTGGNLSMAQGNIRNVPASPALPGFGDINAYGSGNLLNANGQTVYFGAGGPAPSGVSLFNSAYSFPRPFADLFSPFVALSERLRTTPGTALSSLPMNNAVIAPAAGDVRVIDGTRVAVINVAGAVLEATTSLAVNPGTADLVVINVDDANFAYNFSTNNNFGGRQRTLWNFFNATSVSVQNWTGSILAPNATVGGISPLEGNVIANAINTRGEIHWFPLTAPGAFLNGAPPAPPPPVPAVPAPGALALFGLALAGLAAAGAARRPSSGSP